ncbi:MAG: hypothetical protein RLZZ303_2984 [Candidatus Hydrogenedentota bacterium]|jgi:hypothetical protein
MRTAALLSLFLLSGLPLFAEAPQHPLLTPERIAELERGETVVVKAKEREGEKKSAAASAAALAVINKPARMVFDELLAFEQQPEYMPRLVEVSRYEIDPATIGLQHKLKVVWKTIEYHLRMTVNADQLHMAWTLDPAKENGIKTTDGAWTILPWGDDRCIAVYELDVDTGMAVPKFIAQALLNSDLPGVLDALKQRVESGGTWKK